MKEEDIRILQEMIYEVFDADYRDYPKKLVEVQKRRYTTQELLSKMKKYDCWVGEIDGELIGMISLDGNIIKNHFVGLKHRGKGYGRELLDFVEQKAKERNLSSLVIYSAPHLVSYYEKFSFRKMKKCFLEVRGTVIKTILMEKFLESS